MPETFPLALVTGAAHRLGKAFAVALARQGHAILLHYNASADPADATAAELRTLGVPVFPLRADLTDEAQIERLFAEIDALRATGAVGALKVLVNSAGVMQRADAR